MIKLIVVIATLIVIVGSAFMFIDYGNKHPGKMKILELINSKGACDRLKGFIAIGYSKDTFLYRLFFVHMDDGNVSHCLKYYGKKVIWGKIEALKRITGVNPPQNYNPMEPDVKILEQYKLIIETKFLNRQLP